jgi:phage terminase large subunit-like protein|tara:strand:+ start:1039 stop:2289 length:1251 start_codon:yes stop_codon:yes gene_type:complete
MAELNIDLHPAQLQIFKSDARFKIVVAGRRFGKSYLSAWLLLINAIQSKSKDVFYIAPTFQQAKDIMWAMLKDLGQDLIVQAYENTAVLTLINGRKIYLKGSDRPETLRGTGISYVVLDEYASMKPVVWEQIIRPSLADVQGRALFIGTPAGKNHFFDLYNDAEEDNEWDRFQFRSIDNPFLPAAEIQASKKNMSTMSFRQEFEASFETFTGGIFKEEWFKVEEEPEEGTYCIAIDPAGYEQSEKERNLKRSRLDETAIAIVKIDRDKWWVKDILHGRWNIKETAKRILKAAINVEASTIGIEVGALRNAILPYLEDEMRTENQWLSIAELRHGGKKKNDRITWSLQGRMEHGQITFNPEKDWKVFISQLLDFPNRLAHDDLLDSLAYIDQVSVADFAHSIELEEEWSPIDNVAGY